MDPVVLFSILKDRKSFLHFLRSAPKIKESDTLAHDFSAEASIEVVLPKSRLLIHICKTEITTTKSFIKLHLQITKQQNLCIAVFLKYFSSGDGFILFSWPTIS